MTQASTIAGAPIAQALIGQGEVRHQRLRPARHGFAYPTFFVLLPMRRWRDDPQAGGGLARNRRGLIAFHDADHGDGRSDSLAWLESMLAAEGVTDADGEVWLHCFPRVLGYAFKPVSFWYAHRLDGSLAAIVAEVNNTFGERHCYLLQGPDLRFGVECRARKVFHVSPFCEVQGDYRFRFLRTDLGRGTRASDPETVGRTVVRIEHDDAEGPLLTTSVSGELRPATARNLRSLAVRMPLMTLGVIARIHWQALQLWWRKVPFHRKPEPPASFVTR
jgi:DUF1365 family protein